MSEIQEADRRGGERRSSERRGIERRGGERRGGDRRGVRVTTSHGSRQNLYAAAWAIVGALVVIYLFFIVLGSVDPGDAPVVSGIALGLAVLWLAHSWRRLYGGGGISPADRERRGF